MNDHFTAPTPPAAAARSVSPTPCVSPTQCVSATPPQAGEFVERHVYDACPLCASQRIVHERAADCSRHPSWAPPLSPVINWSRCTACGHSFTEGYYTDAALAHVFARTQTNQAPGDNIEANRLLSAAMVEKVLAHAPPGRRWLDVGFGNGSLMFTAQEFGFEVAGLDLRPGPVETMRRFGFEARCEDLRTAIFAAPFDVLSMADVLEHTPFPPQVLAAAHRLLAPQGLLFVSMPNADAFLWKALDASAANPYWGEMEHYHNFGRARLHALLAETGFTPVAYGISQRYRCGMEVVARRD